MTQEYRRPGQPEQVARFREAVDTEIRSAIGINIAGAGCVVDFRLAKYGDTVIKKFATLSNQALEEIQQRRTDIPLLTVLSLQRIDQMGYEVKSFGPLLSEVTGSISIKPSNVTWEYVTTTVVGIGEGSTNTEIFGYLCTVKPKPQASQ